MQRKVSYLLQLLISKNIHILCFLYLHSFDIHNLDLLNAYNDCVKSTLISFQSNVWVFWVISDSLLSVAYVKIIYLNSPSNGCSNRREGPLGPTWEKMVLKLYADLAYQYIN